MRFRRETGCLVVAVLVVAGCGSKQSSLAPESPPAHGIATLWWIMLVGSAIGLAVVTAILIAAWLRKRESVSDRSATRVVVGLGIGVPILILAALFLYSDIFLIRGTSPPPANAATGNSGLTIRVNGHQFWWEVRYPGTKVVTANEIHIPVRTHVEVLLHTKDVIHSFWVPQLNRKVDQEPEQVNRVELYADKVGRYRGQCAEFCGLQHAHMSFYVFADPPATFARWLAQQGRPATRSSALFESKCGSCHAIRGTTSNAHVGPDLTHIGSRRSLGALVLPNSPERMRQWLRQTQHVKPGAQMPEVDLTDQQVNQLTAYLESLK